MNRNQAEFFAAQIFAWLAEDNARIAGFMAWSGEAPASLRDRLDDPGLLLAVLDFLMMDEAMLLDACAALSCPPETPMHARAALPGGDDPHWT